MAVRRAALRYYGGKWRIAPWIIRYFPPHTCYVEPFGGGASVLLRKEPSWLEVYNDLDGDVVNFFRMLRDRSEELIRLIELTTFSREECRLAYEATDDDLERARRFYVKSWQLRGGPTRKASRSGWRFQRTRNRGTTHVSDWTDTSALWDVVHRFRQVQIECDEALRVIERYDGPETLFYLDPPYLAETVRWQGQPYQFEMAEADHRELAGVLNQIEGMAVVSSYECVLYAELFEGWQAVSRWTVDDVAERRKEMLWISPLAWCNGQHLFSLLDEVTDEAR